MVAALTAETATERVQAWLRGLAPGEAVVSDWVTTEVSSALSLKLRTGALDAHRRAAALTAYRRLLEESLVVLTVAPAHFATAARLVERHELGLRAADALHMAVAAETGCVLHTLDRRLVDAGPALGVLVEAR